VLVRVGVGLAFVRVGVGRALEAVALGRGAPLAVADGARVALGEVRGRAAAVAELLAGALEDGTGVADEPAEVEAAAGAEAADEVLAAEPVAAVVPHAASSSGAAATATSTAVGLVTRWCPKVRLA
jgi:hypothetical protein